MSLLFALVPLLDVRRVKPLLLLRADTATTARRRDWRSWLAGAATMAALTLVAMWQAGSVRAGLFVAGGLVVMSIALFVASHLLVKLSRPLARSPRFAVRHAVLSLSRPGNQTRVILMAVGVGCFFILGIRAVQANLLRELTIEVGQNSPDFILIDIQPDQVDGVRAAVTPHLRNAAAIVAADAGPRRRHRWPLHEARRMRRPCANTGNSPANTDSRSGTRLQQNERLVAGTFWSGPLDGAEDGGRVRHRSVD